jgi:hypothetical protein
MAIGPHRGLCLQYQILSRRRTSEANRPDVWRNPPNKKAYPDQGRLILQIAGLAYFLAFLVVAFALALGAFLATAFAFGFAFLALVAMLVTPPFATRYNARLLTC